VTLLKNPNSNFSLEQHTVHPSLQVEPSLKGKDTKSISVEIRITVKTSGSLSDEEHELPQETNIPQVAELYPDYTSLQSSSLGTVLNLLNECLQYSDIAMNSIDESPIISDEAMQQVYFRITELFCLRDLSEGFGMLMTALIACFENQNGLACNISQINAIHYCITELKNKPYLNAENSLNLSDQLTQAGMEIIPPHVKELTKYLSE
jgi:hypothetical protein